MTRASSAPSLTTPPSAIKSTISMLRYGSSPSSIMHGADTLTSEFYAPSRKKRVSFATEVVLKPPPVRQRLRGLSLNDLDHGSSICRAAFVNEADESSGKSSSLNRSTTGRKPSSNKPTSVLERRLVKITRELVEASFEIEVNQNEMDELIGENDVLAMRLARRERAEMGYNNLEHSLAVMERKARKYSSKIATLRRSTEFFNSESSIMIEQLKHSKSLLRRNSRDSKVMLDTIPEVHQTSSSAA